jgi:hypothetical protein
MRLTKLRRCVRFGSVRCLGPCEAQGVGFGASPAPMCGHRHARPSSQWRNASGRMPDPHTTPGPYRNGVGTPSPIRARWAGKCNEPIARPAHLRGVDLDAFLSGFDRQAQSALVPFCGDHALAATHSGVECSRESSSANRPPHPAGTISPVVGPRWTLLLEVRNEQGLGDDANVR